MSSGTTIITAVVAAVVAGCIGVVGGYMLCKKNVENNNTKNDDFNAIVTNDPINDTNRSGQQFKNIFGGSKSYNKKRRKSKSKKRRRI